MLTGKDNVTKRIIVKFYNHPVNRCICVESTITCNFLCARGPAKRLHNPEIPNVNVLQLYFIVVLNRDVFQPRTTRNSDSQRTDDCETRR